MTRYLAILWFALALQGCPAVGTSGLGTVPGASPLAATGPSDVKKDDASQATDPTDAAPSVPSPEETAMRRLPAGDTPSDVATRGLDTPLPAPSFDLGDHGLSPQMGDFYFYGETKRTYTPLADNQLKTDLEGYVYRAHLDQVDGCCGGQSVLIRENADSICTVAKIGPTGYLPISAVSPAQKVPDFSIYFFTDGTTFAEGPQDCDAVLNKASHIKIFHLIGWNSCHATLPAEGTPLNLDAGGGPWVADYCAPRMLDYKIEPGSRFNSSQLRKFYIK